MYGYVSVSIFSFHQTCALVHTKNSVLSNNENKNNNNSSSAIRKQKQQQKEKTKNKK